MLGAWIVIINHSSIPAIFRCPRFLGHLFYLSRFLSISSPRVSVWIQTTENITWDGWRLYTSKNIQMNQEILENGFWMTIHILLMMPKIIKISIRIICNIICIQSFAESSVETRFLELGCILMICQFDGHRQSNNHRNPSGHPVKQMWYGLCPGHFCS